MGAPGRSEASFSTRHELSAICEISALSNQNSFAV
jgi:hypothetical protein